MRQIETKKRLLPFVSWRYMSFRRADVGITRGNKVRDWSKAEWVDPKYNWKPLPVSEMPDRLLIDFATRCNLRCHMCPVWGLEDDSAIDNVKGIMNLDAARRMLDEFTNAQPMVAPSI